MRWMRLLSLMRYSAGNVLMGKMPRLILTDSPAGFYMPPRSLHVFTALAGLCAATAWSQPAPPAAGLSWLHGFQDWVIACDNLRSCEAQGYHAENSHDLPVMLRLQREAGPDAPVRLSLAFGSISAESEQEPPQPRAGKALALSAGNLKLSLMVPAKSAPGQEVVFSPEQIRSLLPALRGADALDVRQGALAWRVSLKGANAALLKMDDLQGRIGTPGALLRPGTKPEASVPPAPALPVIAAQRVPAQAKADEALRAGLYQAVRALPGAAETCPRLTEDAGAASGEVWRLPSGKVLVMFDCWMAAYNTGSGLWQANAKPPYAPQEVRFVSLPEEAKSQGQWSWFNQPSGLTLERGPDGVLQAHSAAKARGIGDCWSNNDWVWNGKFFELSAASASACRLFEMGGALQTLWRASVR